MTTVDKIIAQALRLLCLGIGTLPMRYHEPMARLIGGFWFAVDRRHRRVTIENMERAYPEKSDPDEIKTLARKVFAGFSRLFLEVCWSMKSDPATLARHIDRTDVRYIKEALAGGKGVLILSGHLGNWELLPYVPSLENIQNHAVYRPLDFAPMDHLVRFLRSRCGTGLIPASNALRKIVATLRKNEVIGLLVDQNSDPHNGVAVKFFDQWTYGTKGLALIARHTGAPVLPGFLVRENNGFRFVSGPAIPFIYTGDTRIDIEVNTQAYNRVIEEMVRKYPEQWFWVHRRWKTPLSSPWPRQVAL